MITIGSAVKKEYVLIEGENLVQKMKWILSAASTDITRFVLVKSFNVTEFVEPEKSTETPEASAIPLHKELICKLSGVWVASTDGRRLHAALIPELKPLASKGRYIVEYATANGIVCSLNTDSEYPHWNQVVPKLQDDATEVHYKPDEYSPDLFNLFLAFNKKGGGIMSAKYLNEAAKGFIDGEIFCHAQDAISPFVLANSRTEEALKQIAVVMSMRAN